MRCERCQPTRRPSEQTPLATLLPLRLQALRQSPVAQVRAAKHLYLSSGALPWSPAQLLLPLPPAAVPAAQQPATNPHLCPLPAEAAPGELPSIVVMFYETPLTGQRVWCGGSLIRPTVVLTAAHVRRPEQGGGSCRGAQSGAGGGGTWPAVA